VPWSLDICSIHLLPVHRLVTPGISNQDTQLSPPHNNTSDCLTSTYARHTGRTTGGVRSDWRTLQDYALSPSTPAPATLEWPCKRLERGLTASAPSYPVCIIGVWALGFKRGAEEWAVGHVVLHCRIHRPLYGAHGLTVLGDEIIEWLLKTCHEM